MKEKYEVYEELAKKYLSKNDYLNFQKIDKNNEEVIKDFFNLCEIEIYNSLMEGFKDYFEFYRLREITGIDTDILLSNENNEELLIELLKIYVSTDFKLVKIGNIFVFMVE